MVRRPTDPGTLGDHPQDSLSIWRRTYCSWILNEVGTTQRTFSTKVPLQDAQCGSGTWGMVNYTKRRAGSWAERRTINGRISAWHCGHRSATQSSRKQTTRLMTVPQRLPGGHGGRYGKGSWLEGELS